MTKILKMTLLSAMLCIAATLSAQTDDDFYEVEIPSMPEPWHYVNDFAGLLSLPQINELEQRLYDFADSTTVQIVVATVPLLGYWTAAEFATELGQQWGVGQKEVDNGVVVLVKPKYGEEDYGEAYIATGYGVEGVLPDQRCRVVVDEVMIPFFRENDYAAGLLAGADAVIRIISGDVPRAVLDREMADEQEARDMRNAVIVWSIIYLIIVFFVTLRKGKKQGRRIWPWIIGATILAAFYYLFKLFVLTLKVMAAGGGRGGGSSSGGHRSGGGSFGGGGGGGRW